MSAELESLEQLRRDLVANVSHELKAPISALRAHLENLLDGVERPDPETLQVMLAQSERLGRLVDQLLDLSRLESGDVPLEPVLVDLAPLVSQVLSEIEVARSDRGVDLDDRVPADLPPVLAVPVTAPPASPVEARIGGTTRPFDGPLVPVPVPPPQLQVPPTEPIARIRSVRARLCPATAWASVWGMAVNRP